MTNQDKGWMFAAQEVKSIITRASAEKGGETTVAKQPDKVDRIKDYFACGEHKLALDVSLDWIEKLEREIERLRGTKERV